MIVERIFDVKKCLDVLMDVDMFNSISEDGATFDDIHVDVINNYWLSIYDNELLGVFQIKPMTSSCYEVHIHIIKHHRKKHSKESGEKIIKWCKDNLKGTLYAQTPSYCKNVIKFCESLGFLNTGFIPKAFYKNGTLNDLTILTRLI